MRRPGPASGFRQLTLLRKCDITSCDGLGIVYFLQKSTVLQKIVICFPSKSPLDGVIEPVLSDGNSPVHTVLSPVN